MSSGPPTKRSPSIPDARDKSRLRPSNRLQFIEKHRVFAVRVRAGMLGLHFCPRRHSCPATCRQHKRGKHHHHTHPRLCTSCALPKAATTPSGGRGSRRAEVFSSALTRPCSPINVARAFLTRGTKVGWGRQTDFSSSKNIVFLQYGAEQECSGYIFVLGVIPARPHPEKNTGDSKVTRSSCPSQSPN